MPLTLGALGQVALPVADADRAETFYGDTLGLRRLYRYGGLVFFDCAGLRLMLEQVAPGETVNTAGCLYFRCADIDMASAELARRGVTFDSRAHLIARMPDHDLWMAFFRDPDRHCLALMQEAPKGYVPRSAEEAAA